MWSICFLLVVVMIALIERNCEMKNELKDAEDKLKSANERIDVLSDRSNDSAAAATAWYALSSLGMLVHQYLMVMADAEHALNSWKNEEEDVRITLEDWIQNSTCLVSMKQAELRDEVLKIVRDDTNSLLPDRAAFYMERILDHYSGGGYSRSAHKRLAFIWTRLFDEIREG